jgi:hypothetical protein
MKNVLLIIHCTLFLVFAGCSQSGIEVFTVSGEVLYNGQPVDNAIVQFVAGTPDGRGAFASTENGGKFVIATQGAAKAGAVEGEYTVLVTKIVAVDKSGKELQQVAAEEYTPYNQPKITGPSGPPPTKNFLPKKYVSKETTDLKVKVERKKNYFKLELTDQP